MTLSSLQLSSGLLALSWFFTSCDGGGESSQTASTSSKKPPKVVVEVLMRSVDYSPARVEIEKGQAVEWKNVDIIPHTATSPDFGDSGPLTTGQTWRHTFNHPGEFPYTCTFHPTMGGVVVVK